MDCFFLFTTLLCSLILGQSESTSPFFDKSVYHVRLQYEDAQTIGAILSIQLNRDLYENEQILHADTVGIKCSQNFIFNKTTLEVSSLESLSPGRCDFVIVGRINDYLLSATVVVDVLSPASTACQDQLFGKCSQHCVQGQEFPSGYKCSCENGYFLQSDHTTCLALDPIPKLLISTANEIFEHNLLSQSTRLLLSSAVSIEDFDFSYAAMVLYFATVCEGTSSIFKYSLNTSENFSQLAFQRVNASITSISIDWTSENIYYVDSLSSSVNFWNKTSNSSEVVIGSLNSPRRLIYSSILRKIIWISGFNLNSSVSWIELSVRGLKSAGEELTPVDIAIDPITSQLVILCNNGSIFNYDFVNFHHALDLGQDYSVSIDVFEVFSYVAFNSEITRICTGCSGEKHLSLTANVTDIVEVKVLHPLKQRQFSYDLSCDKCDGGCAVVDQEVKCLCNEGYQVTSNGYSCNPAEGIESIFSVHSSDVNGGNMLIFLNLQQGVENSVVDPFHQSGSEVINTGIIYGIDFDLRSNRIFYGDRNDSSIWTVSMTRISEIQDDRSKLTSNTTVWDISFDWINNCLYWIDDRLDLIYKMPLYTKEVEVFYSGHKLQDIEVDPINGWLYFIENTAINRKQIDSSHVDNIVNETTVLSFKIDILSNKLYWSNSLGAIKESTLDGNIKRDIFSGGESYLPRRLERIRNYLLAILHDNKYLFLNLNDLSISINSLPTRQYLVRNLVSISSLKRPTAGFYSCIKNNCSHYCQNNYDDFAENSCTCSTGYTLDTDGVTCKALCDVPCGNGGSCLLPNECSCLDTYTGIDCSQRECSSSYCLHGGTCSVNFNKLECRCPFLTSGPRCEFSDIIIIPLRNEKKSTSIGISFGIFLVVCFIVGTSAAIIIYKLSRNKKAKAKWDRIRKMMNEHSRRLRTQTLNVTQ